MNDRSLSADYVTAFATGWPEHQPDIVVLSLTTHKGVQDFAFHQGARVAGGKNDERYGGAARQAQGTLKQGR